jgi:predicted nuclease of predicted toxin-antitoxin system
VKLLFDENLSPRLPRVLTSEYPDSAHVRDVGLLGATDVQIWEFARLHGFVIVSKDTDFRERSNILGAPPKIIWLAVGNAGTMAIAYILRRELQTVESFTADVEASVLVLSIGPRPI